MTVANAIDEALRHDDAQERIDELADALGWAPLLPHLFAILEEPARSVADWQLAAACCWGAVLARTPLPADRLIALVYLRLPHDEGSGESNLAWSIASELKGRSYLSRYDPLEDPAVQRELAALRATE